MSTAMNHSRTIQAALDYARRDWPVFPGQSGTHPPIRPEDASSDLLQVWKFWDRSPEAPIALATGSKAGIWALTAHGPDGQKVIDDLTARFGKLPHTPAICCSQVSMTWLFRHSAGRQITTIDCIRGLPVGVQGEHGRVGLPPSCDKEGHEYRWQVSPNHANVAAAPSWLTDWIDGHAPLDAPAVVPSAVVSGVPMAAGKQKDASPALPKGAAQPSAAPSSSPGKDAASTFVPSAVVADSRKTVKRKVEPANREQTPDKPAEAPLLRRRRRGELTYSELMMV